MQSVRNQLTVGAILLLQASAASANPVIAGVTGTIEKDRTVEISGSNFGIKSSAAPLRWETFPGTNGNPIKTEIPWWSSTPSGSARISGDFARVAGRNTGQFELSSDGKDDNIFRNGLGFASTGKIYLNYWTWWDWGTSNNSPNNYFQIKTLTLTPSIDASGNSAKPALSIFNYGYSGYPNTADGYTKSYIANYHNPALSGPTLYFADGTNQRNLMNTPGWYNITMQVDMGTPGVANGSKKLWFSAVDFRQPYRLNSDSNVMVLGDATNTLKIDAVKFGWYRGTTTGGSTVLYYDSLYIDNSWARVEIGNASTYQLCTHREIQPASSWNDARIAVQFNPGTFTPGSSIYLYVTDSNGLVNSSGYPIKIGAGNLKPSPPGVLQAK